MSRNSRQDTNDCVLVSRTDSTCGEIMTPNQPKQRRGWKSLSLTSRIEIIVAVIGVITSIAFGVIAINTDSESPATEDPRKPDFTIDEFNGEMPRCFTITGTAPQEAGKKLLLAHRTGNNKYYFVPVNPMKSGRWNVTQTMGSGTGDVEFYFYLLQVDSTMSDFMGSIEALADDGSGGYYRTTMLPPGAQVKAESTTMSAADPTPCSN